MRWWLESHRRTFGGLFLVMAVLAMTVYVYFSSLWYGFVYDDFSTVINYVHAQTGDFWEEFLKSPRWIAQLVNKLAYSTNDNPFWHRLINICIHITNGILAFVIVFLSRRFSGSAVGQKAAFFNGLLVSALFLLHPVQTQTVLYITQMHLEGMVLLSILIAIFGLQLHDLSSTWRQKTVALLVGLLGVFCAMGAKEIAIMLPALVLLFDWFFIAQGHVKKIVHRWYIYFLYGAVIVGFVAWYGVLTPSKLIGLTQIMVPNSRGNVITLNASDAITLYPFALSQGKVLLHYLRIFLFPTDLCFDYDMHLSTVWHTAAVLWPTALLFALLIAGILLYRRYGVHLLSFSFFWFLVALVPRSSIFPSAELVCDHKTYVASFGVMVGLAYVLTTTGRWLFKAWPIMVAWGASWVRFGALCFLCLGLAYATAQRCAVWRDDYTFWQDAVEKAPKPRVINNFAIALWDRGQVDEAIGYFEQAIKKDPVYAEPHVNLGTIFQIRGDEELALKHYARAIEIGEGHPQLFNNLGMLHASRGALQAAELCFKQAIALHATTANPYLNLGRLYEQAGRFNDALEIYSQAITFHVTTNELLYAYGLLAYKNSNFMLAESVFKHLDMAYEQTAFLLGQCYYKEQNYARAAVCFGQAYHKDPLNLSCIYSYAQALMHNKQYKEAIGMFDLCMTHEQEFPHVVLYKIRCLHAAGDKERAQNLLQAFLAKPLPGKVAIDAATLSKQIISG